MTQHYYNKYRHMKYCHRSTRTIVGARKSLLHTMIEWKKMDKNKHTGNIDAFGWSRFILAFTFKAFFDHRSRKAQPVWRMPCSQAAVSWRQVTPCTAAPPWSSCLQETASTASCLTRWVTSRGARQTCAEFGLKHSDIEHFWRFCWVQRLSDQAVCGKSDRVVLDRRRFPDSTCVRRDLFSRTSVPLFWSQFLNFSRLVSSSWLNETWRWNQKEKFTPSTKATRSIGSTQCRST